MLVTALEANADVPKLEVVTKRLLHEERKLKDREGAGVNSEKAMTARQRPRVRVQGVTTVGDLATSSITVVNWLRKRCPTQVRKRKSAKQKANKVEARQRNSSSSDSESIGLVVRHALAASAGRLDSWIVDSGATCHMCNDQKLFVELHNLEKPLKVTLGNGYGLDAIGRGVVVLETKLPSGRMKKCKLHDVLYVPKLSYKLLSVLKATELGKTTRFGEASCQILDANSKLIAVTTRVGDLYYLNCRTDHQQFNTAESKSWETKEDIWHRRFGHLGVRNLQKLAKHKLVDGFNYDSSISVSHALKESITGVSFQSVVASGPRSRLV